LGLFRHVAFRLTSRSLWLGGGILMEPRKKVSAFWLMRSIGCLWLGAVISSGCAAYLPTVSGESNRRKIYWILQRGGPMCTYMPVRCNSFPSVIPSGLAVVHLQRAAKFADICSSFLMNFLTNSFGFIFIILFLTADPNCVLSIGIARGWSTRGKWWDPIASRRLIRFKGILSVDCGKDARIFLPPALLINNGSYQSIIPAMIRLGYFPWQANHSSACSAWGWSRQMQQQSCCLAWMGELCWPVASWQHANAQKGSSRCFP